MANDFNLYHTDNVVKWVEFMKTRLDRYEVERNEFTADYRMPPKNVMFYREVILPFAENTLIMDNLTASEGVRYNKCGCNNNLRIRCFINGKELKATYPNLKCLPNSNCSHEVDCTTICYPDFFPYLVQSKNDESLENAFNNKEITGGDDIEICLPSEHAFYSILENFIRNSAKHNKQQLKGKQLEIYISIFEKGDNLYEVNLYDNVSTMSVEKLVGLVEGKRQSLLNEAGELKREKLGIADMKINAHLLCSSQDIEDDLLKEHLEVILLQASKNSEFNDRFCRESEIFSLKEKELTPEKERKGETIEVFIKTNNIDPEPQDMESDESNYRFGYRFHLAKSKKVCWIGKVDDQKEVLKKQGIYLFEDWEEFDKQKDGTLAAFQFAILEPGVLEDWKTQVEEDKRKELEDELEKKLLRLPFRVLLNSTKVLEDGSILKDYTKTWRRIQQVEEPIKIENEKTADYFKILKSCWENWLGWFEDLKKGHLVVTTDTNDIKLTGWDDENLKKFNSNKFCFQYSNEPITKPLNNKKPKIFWDHHGNGGVWDPTVFSEENTFLNQNCYLEFGKTNPDFTSIVSQRPDEKWLFPYELFEAGLLRILIVDERFTEFALLPSGRNPYDPLAGRGFLHSNDRDYTYNFDACWASNTYIVTHIDKEPLVPIEKNYEHILNLSLDINNYDPKSLSLKLDHSFNHVYDSKHKNQKFDVIIMHRTYLNESYRESIRCGLETGTFLHLLKKEIPCVILSSGGSSQHGIQGIFKFISFNEIKKPFVNGKGIGKLSLSQDLLNLTKKNS